MTHSEQRAKLYIELRDLSDRRYQLNEDARSQFIVYAALSGDDQEAFGKSLLKTYADAIEEITARIQEISEELLKLSACDTLYRLVGEELHDYFQERFPITQNTRVIHMPRTMGQSQVYFAIPETSFVLATVVSSHPAPKPARTGVATFHEYAATGIRIYLAYAAEIDTVYWSDKRVLSWA